METKINLEEFIPKNMDVRDVVYWDDLYPELRKLLTAFGEQLLQLAAENAKVDVSMYYPDTKPKPNIQEVLCDHYHDREWHLSVDKETIINTMDQVE